MDNPLVLPEHPLRFDRIRADQIVFSVRGLIEQAKAELSEISLRTDRPDWESTLGALEESTGRLEVATAIVEHLESCATYPELREAYNEMLPLTVSFWTGIPLHRGLYSRLRLARDWADKHPLDPVRRRALDKTLDDFRRQGAELDSVGRSKLEQIDEELGKATTKFSQNVLDATQAFELLIDDIGKLEGLPESALAEARHRAAARNFSGWRITLAAPSLLSVLSYADDAGLREQLWKANDGRCLRGAHDNRQLLRQILELRREKAKVLGHANFADWVLQDRMAKTTENARSFIDDLAKRTVPAFVREAEELRQFATSEGILEKRELAPWDLAYVAEKLRRKKHHFDEQDLRPYFSAEQMLEAVFTMSSELFGISIVPVDGLPTWDRSVRTYAMNDADGTRLAIFYVDLYPRDNKAQGAWMHGLVTGEPNIAVIVANANAPTDDRPSLLTHRDVETLWHEFGHLLHHCLSRVPVRSLAGTRVARDFVELPSQIMENWCWDPKVLRRFARHFQTGEPIPESLVERLLAARTFRAATAQMRQLGFAALDLALHADFDPASDGDILEYARRVQQPFVPVELPDPYGMATTFTHLFSRSIGYAAGYYSYKWSEVLDADAFGRFGEAGTDLRSVGALWRREVLEKGDARDPLESFVAFRGRSPRPDALLARLGLAP